MTSSGSSTWHNAEPGSPACLPGLRPDRVRDDPPRGRRSGPSEDGGFDDVAESLPSFNTSACTCAVNLPTRTSASICSSLAESSASSSARDNSSGPGMPRPDHGQPTGGSNLDNPGVSRTT